MLQLLISVVAFLVAVTLLVAVHEFGHFWVARQFGIKVLRFSIGFGRSLYRWYDKLGTEYSISMIPLGGYVSLLGEQAETVPMGERAMAFIYKPVWVRLLVLIAGPGFNLLFAVLLYWALFLHGTTALIPILGPIPKDSVAASAGLKAGQEIISVEGKATPDWETVSLQLLSHLGEDKAVSLTVREKLGAPHSVNLDLGQLTDGLADSHWMENLGLVPLDPVPPRVGKVLAREPGSEAGLQTQDLIVKVDGKPTASRSELIHYIQAHPKQWIVLEILRADRTLTLSLLTRVKPSDTGKDIGFIGVEFPPLKEMPKHLTRVQKFGVMDSFKKALRQTMDYSVLTLECFKKMIAGTVSVRHINGPLVIAKYAGETASIGIKEFIEFLGKISISLGILNLLPIPILDGGHCLYCVYECITGRRLSEVAQRVGLWIGGVILVGLMILAFYNDMTQLLR